MAIFVVMLIKGRPWTWIQNGAVWKDSSFKVACGCHGWRMMREPLTFQVTCLWILVRCSGLGSLNRNLFGPKIANKKGTANSQALENAAKTDWLLCVLWEMMWPTKGRDSSLTVSAVRESIWVEGSSQERASVWVIRLLISARREREV